MRLVGAIGAAILSVGGTLARINEIVQVRVVVRVCWR